MDDGTPPSFPPIVAERMRTASRMKRRRRKRREGGEVSVVSALAVNRPHYTGNAHEVCLGMSEGGKREGRRREEGGRGRGRA